LAQLENGLQFLSISGLPGGCGVGMDELLPDEMRGASRPPLTGIG
jgi:hypothetical protein